jgi:hypothetical protein
MAVLMVNWNLGPNLLDLLADLPVAAMPTHVILAAVGLVLHKICRSRLVHQCTLQPLVGRQQTVLAHPILTMVLERRLGMPLRVVTRTKLLPPTPKAMNCMSMIM